MQTYSDGDIENEREAALYDDPVANAIAEAWNEGKFDENNPAEGSNLGEQFPGFFESLVGKLTELVDEEGDR